MAGFIRLDDGRCFRINNGSFDRLVELVAEALPSSSEGRDLAEWLLDQNISIYGNSRGMIDVRELTRGNQRLFTQATQEAFARLARHNTVHDGFVGAFHRLLKMMKAVRRSASPSMLNDQMNVEPATLEKSGPGWGEGEAKR